MGNIMRKLINTNHRKIIRQALEVVLECRKTELIKVLLVGNTMKKLINMNPRKIIRLDSEANMEFSQIELTNRPWDGIIRRELPSMRVKQDRRTSRLASRAPVPMNKLVLLAPTMLKLNLTFQLNTLQI